MLLVSKHQPSIHYQTMIYCCSLVWIVDTLSATLVIVTQIVLYSPARRHSGCRGKPRRASLLFRGHSHGGAFLVLGSTKVRAGKLNICHHH